MSNILEFPAQGGRLSLRGTYAETLRRGKTRLGRIDAKTAYSYAGFMTGAAVALRYAGDDEAADLFEKTAAALFADWWCCNAVIAELYDALIE